MVYYTLASIFFLTIAIAIAILLISLFHRKYWKKNRSKIINYFGGWLILYALFIFFFTGPTDLTQYPQKETSPYKLPWKAGVTRFVAQGNRSFTSHREFHYYAWDFVMKTGTEILAVRDGKVVQVEDQWDGIGYRSNFMIIEHEDGQKSNYAHFRKNGTLVKVGDIVKQGQPIALSGMVGQTIFPHVHFCVMNKEGTSSIPISFSDVPDDGIPLAGRFYTSGNGAN